MRLLFMMGLPDLWLPGRVYLLTGVQHGAALCSPAMAKVLDFARFAIPAIAGSDRVQARAGVMRRYPQQQTDDTGCRVEIAFCYLPFAPHGDQFPDSLSHAHNQLGTPGRRRMVLSVVLFGAG